MLKKFGKQFETITKRKKRIILKLFFILFAVEVIRVYIFMPLLIFFCVVPIDYQGMKYYENETYLEFEKGEKFIDSFQSYDFADQCDVTEFYYCNNWLRDNLLYGKHHDVYILDFDAGAHYEKTREFIVSEGIYNNELNSFEIYMMSNKYEDKTERFFWAFNDETQEMRYILVTEIKGFNKDIAIRNIVNVFIKNSSYW